MFTKSTYTALTIAGSDSGAGAGIQADLKTFASLGVYGTSAITAVTAQNTIGVQSVFPLPAEVVADQIDSVVSDIGADAIKTGMLFNEEIITVVEEKIKQWKLTNYVIDPVMVSSSGKLLLKESAVTYMAEKLFPLATIITPNRPEAEYLTGISLISMDKVKEACIYIVEKYGANAVVIKGGHSVDNDSTDVLYYADNFYEYKATKIVTKNLHGTGCTYSAAITAFLANELDIFNSVKLAKGYITNTIRGGKTFETGKGSGPLNHFWNHM